MQGKIQELFYKYIWDTRSVNLENPKTPLNGFSLDQALGGNISGSGRSISYNSALTLSAVYRAVAIKSGFISSMPFQVFRNLPNGDRILEKDHPVSYLLSRKPNDKVSKVIFFDRAMQHYELLGNHFAKIYRNGIGRVVSYELLHPDEVSVLETDNRLMYEITEDKKKVVYSADDIIHVPNMGDWLNGKSVISYMREDASLIMDVRGYGTSFFGNNGKPAALLLPKSPASPVQRQEMKQSFKDAKNQGGEVAMPFGWEYKEISIPPKDADWVTTNDFSIATIARWFGVPTQKLGDSKIKYSNVEYMGIEFLQDTMAPIAAKFENEYTNKSFMLSSERDLYCEFNLDAYLRADSVSKSESLAKRIQNAMITPNEARKLDNRPAIEGGDDLFIQGATVPLRLQESLYADKNEAAKEKKTRQSLRKKIEKQVKEGVDPQLILEGFLGNDGKGY